MFYKAMAQSKKERLLAMIGKTKAVKFRQGVGGEIPKEPEVEGEGLREQISNKNNDIDEYASMFAEGTDQ